MNHKQKAHDLLRELKDDPVQPLSSLLRHELAEVISKATEAAEVAGFQTANLRETEAGDPDKQELAIALTTATARVTQLETGFQMVAQAIHKGDVTKASLLDFCARMIKKTEG